MRPIADEPARLAHDADRGALGQLSWGISRRTRVAGRMVGSPSGDDGRRPGVG